jgi:hypothetical protein
MYASLRLRRVEDKLRLSVFLQDRIVMVHRHRSIRIPVGGCADPKNRIVQPICQSRRPNHGKNYSDTYSAQANSKVRDR